VPASPLIKIRQLRKAYHEGDETRWIFDQLDLDIQPGELVALVGRSGSGKSTLLNLISGIDLPDAGLLRVDGHVLTALNETERTRFRRSRLGFVFQFFNLIPTLTVAENVLLPLELNGLNTPVHCQRAFALLEQVGLSDRLKSFPERLSGGEQQRLAIVRALVHRPSLLLADEPTGNLDAETSAHVMEILLELPRQANTTVLMVTHSRELASQADRLLALQSGQVQEISP
jgi:putative ABC transport system ATP-binding protein